jgi:hypothetical protein
VEQEQQLSDLKQLGMEIESSDNMTTSTENLHARPRSNTCPNLHSSSNSKKLKYGSKVIILGTDNVEQRVPQYVGAEATIVDVPGMPLPSPYLVFSHPPRF